jgi:hypothetical protein
VGRCSAGGPREPEARGWRTGGAAWWAAQARLGSSGVRPGKGERRRERGASRGGNAERAGATGDDVQGSCVRAGDAREPSAGAKPTASGEQMALARGRWADRSWSAAQWKQRVGSGVARIGAKSGYADARIE